MLESEAAVSGGYLAVDTAPHFVVGEVDIVPESGEDGVVALPEGTLVVEEEAFVNDGVQVLKVPESCTRIEDGAFRDCKQLREVWLPEGCEVAESAFEGCDALAAVYAPAG